MIGQLNIYCMLYLDALVALGNLLLLGGMMIGLSFLTDPQKTATGNQRV